jgi:predicted dehydrogenase
MSIHTPFRTLIVGMGGLSNAMSKLLRQYDWQRIVGVVDIRTESLQKAQTELDLPEEALFTDLGRALGESQADVVLINTPSELHFAQCKAALLAGKDVLVAKPITNNFEQAVELVDLAASLGRKLCVGQQMRFHRHFQAVRQFIASGELGRVEMANFLNAKPRHKALNLKGMAQPVLYEISCHHFDSLLSVFPQQVPEAIFCHGFRPSWSVYDGPCSVNALIDWSEGLHMLYHGGISSQSDLYEFRLEGERGALRCRGIHMSNDTMHYDFALRGGNFAKRAIDEHTPLVNPWTIFFDQWRSYMTTNTSVDGALADDTEPHFTGRNNLKVFAMLSAGIDSIESGRRMEIAGNPRYRKAFEPVQ